MKIRLKELITCSTLFFLGVANSTAGSTSKIKQIAGIIIPEAFTLALRDGMKIPLFLHLNGTEGTRSDQRVGNASVWLDDYQLRVGQIQLEDHEGNATLNKNTQQKLIAITEVKFDEQLKVAVTSDAWLQLNLHQLRLQLIVNKEAMGMVLHSRSEDIGGSSTDAVSGTLNYNLGVYNNQMRAGGSSTSNFLSYRNVTSLREHHIAVDGSLYGIGTSNRQSALYKFMYERDFAGHRFAAGMLDAWNIQSLGPITGIAAGKIYGVSWGNQAQSTVFDNAQSATPVIVFLPAAGEVHIYREGKLLSVQNFGMGNHEVDTRGLPYGIYDVNVEIVVNGRITSKTTQRVNKIFSRYRSTGMPLRWQFWGGRILMDAHQFRSRSEKKDGHKASMLVGASLSGSAGTLGWSASGYSYNGLTIGETQLSWPVTEKLSLNLQNMVASDRSWSSIYSVNATLPGGFSSLWLSQEKTMTGNTLRHSDANNRAIGGSINLNALWSKLGVLSGSYNEDLLYGNHYYTGDYSQTIFTGSLGTLGLRAGIQRYQNGYRDNGTEKYIALDLSLPLGNWLRAGMAHQNGNTMANLSAQKQFYDGVIRGVGADLSRAISSRAGDDKTLNGGVWTNYETRFSSGTLNINRGVDGYINTNLSANGSFGWQGDEIALSGKDDGDSGVILRTDMENDGKLIAKINGRNFQLTGKQNYIPLHPYSRYEIEIMNSQDSLDSYDISAGKKSKLTLYPGNVAIVRPEVKQMVTVFGRIRAEDGSLLTHARISNHIGRTNTDEHGEFIMDIDKKYPVIDFQYGSDESCEIALELSNVRGAVWVGDVICQGLKSYVSTLRPGTKNAG
ncbi:fimbrial biogenesis outer membrane usher protein [Kosakonia sacchari]|uniref:fimbrial biogenesis outer membrane usher protein n=1 Tax=Kosakonia sacchari TaxID=1158459 RepID=UPI000BE527DF|nr:hypothetical protein BK797_06970 [Kosakonia sacchari]